ncbi:efflux RND transporter periplasmic adaptor subunit [Psychromicrobium xiongbiense]|uniref:efflux RND transporter periplasmic adaptor subunit n=1 Tax=Psychromicrobium xiongbiense TaxID=3051184 RepID=UPI00255523E5|nr:efflux RND transporter periplasmic adaptor subunit [Psychromicrobium sp. YIM S02556]
MRILRRVVFPVVWLVIFAVIALALVKIAFMDGLKPTSSTAFPQATVAPAIVPVTRGTINNVVEVKGSLVTDPAVPVLSNAAGTVVKIFVDPQATVAAGDPLFQVKSMVQSTTAAPAAGSTGNGTGKGDAVPAAPTYRYQNVLAPAAGTLQNFTLLLEQQVSVGQNLGGVVSGSLSAQASLTAEQQYRLLGQVTQATITVNGGPAPFDCGTVAFGAADAAVPNAGGAGATGTEAKAGAMPGPAAPGSGSSSGSPTTGKVSCAIPAGTPVFSGLGATMQLTAGSAKNVLVVPLSAVKGSFKSGQVWVATDKGQEKRDVELGLNDGKQVEVTKGLAEGERVLQYVPGAPAQNCPPGAPCPPGGNPGGGQPMTGNSNGAAG